MGDPRKIRKTYENPRQPWNKERIVEEAALKREFGYKNKKELWKAESLLRSMRGQARTLIAKRDDKQAQLETKQFLTRLNNMGLLLKNAKVEDVLALTIKDLLKRRLQTIMVENNLARTIKEARQAITHGQVYVGPKRMTAPSYLVLKKEENLIRRVKQ